MKISCEVIGDLLPLYVKGIASKDSQMLIEEHLVSCPDCAKKLESMKKQFENELSGDVYVRSLKKVKNTLLRKRVQTIVFTVMLTLTIAAVIIANLTAPNYIPYSPKLLQITEKNDGTVLVKFEKDVSGYILWRSKAEIDPSGHQYDIVAWSSYWNKHIVKSRIQNVVLNPDGEKVSAVYYLNYFGSDSGPDTDILIYGEDQYPNGGRLTLPRLFLTYYLLIAFAMFIIIVLLLVAFYRNGKAKYWLLRVAAIPGAYIVSHFCVKGLDSSSFTPVRDFIAIVTIAVSLYIVFLLGSSLIGYYRRKAGKAMVK